MKRIFPWIVIVAVSAANLNGCCPSIDTKEATVGDYYFSTTDRLETSSLLLVGEDAAEVALEFQEKRDGFLIFRATTETGEKQLEIAFDDGKRADFVFFCDASNYADGERCAGIADQFFDIPADSTNCPDTFSAKGSCSSHFSFKDTNLTTYPGNEKFALKGEFQVLFQINFVPKHTECVSGDDP